MDVYHVIPVDDIKPHTQSENCKCAPTVENNLVIHNSFDGREFFEDGYPKGH